MEPATVPEPALPEATPTDQPSEAKKEDETAIEPVEGTTDGEPKAQEEASPPTTDNIQLEAAEKVVDTPAEPQTAPAEEPHSPDQSSEPSKDDGPAEPEKLATEETKETATNSTDDAEVQAKEEHTGEEVPAADATTEVAPPKELQTKKLLPTKLLLRRTSPGRLLPRKALLKKPLPRRKLSKRLL